MLNYAPMTNFDRMAEAKRRFEELDKGLVKAIPWEEARKRLFENR